MDHETAQTLALRLLDWLLAEEDLSRMFLASTGLDAAHLRQNADNPELLAALLDFVLMDDAWILAAAGHLHVDPMRFQAVRAALPGGAAPHWT